jgi:hypothetical protein
MKGAAAVWNNLANTAAWIFHITVVARNNMHVKMKYRLACGRAHVSPDVVTVGAKFCLKDLFYLPDQHADCPMLFSSGVKVSLNMPLWYDQGMPFTNRTAIIKG